MEQMITFRAYRLADYDQVAALWTRINRELAPVEMRELFEQYIATALDGELRQLLVIFSERKRNAFWIVEFEEKIIGTFGLESVSDDTTELRRMYLDQQFRGKDIAQSALRCAEERARRFGFAKIILSTAEVQAAAIAFYQKSGFVLVKTEVAHAMSTKNGRRLPYALSFREELEWLVPPPAAAWIRVADHGPLTFSRRTG